MKKFSVWGWLLLASLMLTVSCKDDDAGEILDPTKDNDRSIVIIYDNDVHCAIEGYAKMVGYRDAIVEADTAWVATVSAGDYVQGGAVGSLSQGQYVIDVMKEVGYDAITLGNHEFDYKVPQMRHLMDQLPAGTVTCCNFYNAAHDSLYYKEYVIKQMGKKKVAFVGVTTPGTMVSESYSFFAEDGVTKLYDLREADCVTLVQNAVDHARAEGADYVILLAHLGESDRGSTTVYTPTLLAKTRGINAILDGHTHSTIPGQTYPNIDGDIVYSMQTGSKFQHVGKLIISADGKISSELVPVKEITQVNAKVAQAIDGSNGKVNEKLKEEISYNYSPDFMVEDDKGENMARYKQVPLGTLICDAFIYVSAAEIGIINGGGVRTSLPQGTITYGSLLNILPFSNELCFVRATGQQILDALETSVSLYPMLSGGFLQFSGLHYEFDPNNTPKLEYDPETYVLSVQGTRRITKCEVLDPDDGKYHPIDPERKYTVASTRYVLKESLEVTAFRQSEVLYDKVEATDLDALLIYVLYGLGNGIPENYAKLE